jgi:hypothetical protein
MSKLHFMQTDKWYSYLTSTAYNEMEFKEWQILKEVEVVVSDKELEKLQTTSWVEVREWIKNKVEGILINN